MALWLVRAGKYGQLEQQFLQENRIYMRWGNLIADLRDVSDRDAVKNLLRELIPDAKEGKIVNGAGQIWAFVDGMRIRDWFVLPSKLKPAVHIGEITSELKYSDGVGSYRDVEWLETDIPRSNFDQDLLYSFGAYMTFCRIHRNDAERRVKALAKAGWQSTSILKPTLPTADGEASEDAAPIDIESTAQSLRAQAIDRGRVHSGASVSLPTVDVGHVPHTRGHAPMRQRPQSGNAVVS